MKIKFSKAMAVILIAVMMFTGCGSSNKGASDDKSFTIVTSFYPMYISAINLAKDIPGVKVINMTKPQTGCLHDYSLSPSDLVTLEKADAFIVNGAGMESFLDKVVSQQPDLTIIDSSKGIELLKDDSGEENPHLWVSVTKYIEQIKNIQSALEKADPDNKDKYKANGDAYLSKLEKLKSEMHAAIDNVKNKDIITFHEAFPYFAQEFNLNISTVIEREPGTDPTPKELEDTIALVKKSNIKALFVEPQYSPKSAETIARETGATLYTLDPVVTGEASSDNYDDYINKMKENAKTLQGALNK